MNESPAPMVSTTSACTESTWTPGADSELAWAVIDADLHFHRVIFQFTNNTYIKAMADALNGQSHRARQSAEQGISDDLEALNEHAAIAKAAHSGYPQIVEAAVKNHIDLVRQRARTDSREG
ncbi:FCD domain-containing protein [Herbiconiux sp. UC225_62]|uniref:FCD domain-containing protein n=1 Tax=Herbiconiux sp. UC225_62 TaxID=3350168 RepID=UPI0036D2BAD4